MKVDGFEARVVRTRIGLTLRWTDDSGTLHVAIGLEQDVEAAGASADEVTSGDLAGLHLQKVY
jgi:hypothetical protein